MKNNIKNIQNYFTGNIYIKLFNYGNETCDFENTYENIIFEEIFEKGVIGQFLFKHITPDMVKNFDYILLLLDDIELNNSFNLNQIIYNLNYYEIDILSPILDKTSKFSHWCMVENKNCDNNKIRITNFIELFCYVMTKDSYCKWYKLLNKESCWLWGIDFALFNLGFKLAILEGITMHHHFKGTSYNKELPDPYCELNTNKNRYDCINPKKLFNYKLVDYLKIDN